MPNTKRNTEIRSFQEFWKIPRAERAKGITAFVTTDELLQYKVRPFVMKNS